MFRGESGPSKVIFDKSADAYDNGYLMFVPPGTLFTLPPFVCPHLFLLPAEWEAAAGELRVG